MYNIFCRLLSIQFLFVRFAWLKEKVYVIQTFYWIHIFLFRKKKPYYVTLVLCLLLFKGTILFFKFCTRRRTIELKGIHLIATEGVPTWTGLNWNILQLCRFITYACKTWRYWIGDNSRSNFFIEISTFCKFSS